MTKNTDAVKIFKTRDSATSLLRKLGIQPRDYNFFIEKMTDGRVTCQVARAEMYLKSLKNPQPTPRKVSHEGVGAVARGLIREGKTNKEIWEIIQPRFGLSDSKKNYPAWYRAEMKRKESSHV